MGLTVLKLEVANPANPDVVETVEFLIDSGALYSLVPRAVLQRLGINPLKAQTFRLANGQSIERQIGGALFKYQDRVGVATVIFGEEEDSTLLGAYTLESMGLSLDPVRRQLVSVPMTLAWGRLHDLLRTVEGSDIRWICFQGRCPLTRDSLIYPSVQSGAAP